MIETGPVIINLHTRLYLWSMGVKLVCWYQLVGINWLVSIG